MKLYSFLTCV